jgi:Na+-transporting methylmalonyl-CoA/oxaloacetate decarboxylase gamma subunit
MEQVKAIAGKVVTNFLGAAVAVVVLYICTVLVWFVIGYAARVFGYQSEREREEKAEMFAMVATHRQVFCSSRHLILTSLECDRAFHDSDAEHQAIVEWVNIKMARDKERQENAPFWGLLEVFRNI